MFGLGMPELIIILVIATVVVGPGKIPQIGSALGGAIRGFRKAAEEDPKLLTPEPATAAGTKAVESGAAAEITVECSHDKH